MGLGEEVVREFVRHRLYGRHRRQSGYWTRGHYERPFFDVLRPRPRRRVEVSGCGCCLPIPIGVLAAAGLGLGVLHRSRD
jgi:hypothetical protein